LRIGTFVRHRMIASPSEAVTYKRSRGTWPPIYTDDAAPCAAI